MPDPFKSLTPGLESPSREVLDITPSDSAELPVAVRALNVAQTGSLRIETVSGSVASVHVAAGIVFPVRVRRVFATGTDALGIVGLV